MDYEFEIGDEVWVVGDTDDGHRFLGQYGIVREIDPFDNELPYRVEFEDGDYDWAFTHSLNIAHKQTKEELFFMDANKWAER